MTARGGHVHSSESDALDVLRVSSLFGVLSEDDLRSVAERLGRARFLAGEEIVREGDLGDCCYLVASGRAQAIARDLIGQETVLATFSPGDAFGEMTLASASRRSSTVRALTDVEVYVLDQALFSQVASRDPAFDRHVRQHVDLLAIDSFLKKASPFRRLPAQTIGRLARLLETVRLRAGEVIIREGDLAEHFYLIRSGGVEVVRHGKRIATLGAGDCFGEVALLTDRRRTALVRASQETELLALARDDFHAVVVQGNSTPLRMQIVEFARIRAPDDGTGSQLPAPRDRAPWTARTRRKRWRIVLSAGSLAFGALTALALSSSAYVVGPVLLLGALLVPVTFVTFLAEANYLAERPRTLVGTFLCGAASAIPVAVILRALVPAPTMGFGLVPALTTAVVEEIAKLLGVAWLMRRRAFRFQMDGVILGAAAGMGFAAVETATHALALGDTVYSLLRVLWLRSMLAPFGHGTWTAIICAGIWLSKGAGRPRWDRTVAASFGVSILLHTLWDWEFLPGFSIALWRLGVGAGGVAILWSILRKALAGERAAILALNPESAHSEGEALSCRACGQVGPPGGHYCARCGSALRRD